MIVIDGSHGEGGGQILRSALALSVVTGEGFRIENIRANRPKAGLLRQHLTAVQAAAEISGATAAGDVLGSQTLEFRPGKVKAGTYRFAVGTAGSATLVLQTVLPGLLRAEGESQLELEGGTHNPFAPSFDFLDRCFLPLLQRMGAEISTGFVCPGFYPAGGGKFSVRIGAAGAGLKPLELVERGEIRARSATILIAGLPRSIAERERRLLAHKTGWEEEALEIREFPECHGPGNAITVAITSAALTEVFTGFGQRGVTAETVVERVVKEVRRYLASSAPVGEHLADQLLMPLALAGGGRFRAVGMTEHTRTNMEVIRRFLPVGIEGMELGDGTVEVVVG